MTSISAKNHFDEVVTPEVLTQAIQRGQLRASAGVHASGVQYVPLPKSLLISFVDHSAVALPIQSYPELAARCACKPGICTCRLPVCCPPDNR